VGEAAARYQARSRVGRDHHQRHVIAGAVVVLIPGAEQGHIPPAARGCANDPADPRLGEAVAAGDAAVVLVVAHVRDDYQERGQPIAVARARKDVARAIQRDLPGPALRADPRVVGSRGVTGRVAPDRLALAAARHRLRPHPPAAVGLSEDAAIARQAAAAGLTVPAADPAGDVAAGERDVVGQAGVCDGVVAGGAGAACSGGVQVRHREPSTGVAWFSIITSTTERTCGTVPASAPQGAVAVTAGRSNSTGTAFGWAAVIPSRQTTRIVPMTARQVIGRWCISWVYRRRRNLPTA